MNDLRKKFLENAGDFFIEVTPPKPIEPPQEPGPFTDKEAKEFDESIARLYEPSPSPIDTTEQDREESIIVNGDYVYGTGPTHINTTAPVVLEPELQVAGYVECPSRKGEGCEADYVGLEMRCIQVDCSRCNGKGRVPNSQPCLHQTYLGEGNIEFCELPAGHDNGEHAPKPAAKPNELAVAQAVHSADSAWNGYKHDHPDFYSKDNRGLFVAGWNAQQAKIEALEQQLKDEELVFNHANEVVGKQEATIAELEQQILLIQSNASANYAEAENRTHAVEEELGVTKRALELANDDVNRYLRRVGVNDISTVELYEDKAREEKLREVGK